MDHLIQGWHVHTQCVSIFGLKNNCLTIAFW